MHVSHTSLNSKTNFNQGWYTYDLLEEKNTMRVNTAIKRVGIDVGWE